MNRAINAVFPVIFSVVLLTVGIAEAGGGTNCATAMSAALQRVMVSATTMPRAVVVTAPPVISGGSGANSFAYATKPQVIANPVTRTTSTSYYVPTGNGTYTLRTIQTSAPATSPYPKSSAP